MLEGVRGETPGGAFNGVHLRMEKDAADWATIMGGPERYWARYKQARRRGGSGRARSCRFGVDFSG